MYLLYKSRGHALFQGLGDGIIIKTVYFLENYIGSGDLQCRYIRCRFSYICRTKQAKIQLPYGKLFGTTEHITL
jgi:hypothetical protein